jgi:hypothetical protein
MTTSHQFLKVEDTSKQLKSLLSHLKPSEFEKHKDPSNIDYIPESDVEKKEHYLQYLKPDLISLGLPLLGNHTERTKRLRSALELLTQKKEIQTTLRVTGENAGALMLLRQAIPCILHCENRCGEKFLKMFLLEIFNHFAGLGKPFRGDTVIVEPSIVFNFLMLSLVMNWILDFSAVVALQDSFKPPNQLVRSVTVPSFLTDGSAKHSEKYRHSLSAKSIVVCRWYAELRLFVFRACMITPYNFARMEQVRRVRLSLSNRRQQPSTASTFKVVGARSRKK